MPGEVRVGGGRETFAEALYEDPFPVVDELPADPARAGCVRRSSRMLDGSRRRFIFGGRARPAPVVKKFVGSSQSSPGSAGAAARFRHDNNSQ